MTFLRSVIRITARPESYGHDVLIAWEFDPEVFVNMLHQVTSRLKKNNISFNKGHQEKSTSPDAAIWGLKGNDWSHVTIMMLEKYNEKDEEKIEELAKANVPEWTVKGFRFLESRNPNVRYLVLELEYPPAAQKFESEFRKYAGNRIADRSTSKFEFVPHASLVAIKKEDEEKVAALVKEIKLPSQKIPTEAIQTWDDFQVADHILL